MINFLGEPSLFSHHIESLILGDEPFFLSRIGGSDTDAAIDYIAAKKRSDASALEATANEHLPIVMKYNGFYAKSGVRENYFSYLDTLISCYRALNVGTMGGGKLLSIYYPKIVRPQHRKFHGNIERIVEFFDFISDPWRKLDLYPYNFVENIGDSGDTLFKSLSKTLTGKRVLVVSPFAESIQQNYHRRHGFFKEIRYPEFELCVVNTPVTYGGLPDELYPHENWFDTVEHLNELVRCQRFDLALLACGSYALPIGEFIKSQLGRKAIYVGGVLQLFFGIMGRRYESSFFTQHINLEYFIYPIERDIYLKGSNIPEDMVKEAFGAYF